MNISYHIGVCVEKPSTPQWLLLKGGGGGYIEGEEEVIWRGRSYGGGGGHRVKLPSCHISWRSLVSGAKSHDLMPKLSPDLLFTWTP